MTNRPLLVQVVGIRRSGNHAIIEWLKSMYASPVHENNLRHDFFRTGGRERMLQVLRDADCAICSFENFPEHQKPGMTLVDSAELLSDAEVPPSVALHTVFILRDAYNLAASLLKSGRIADAEALGQFVEEWVAIARVCANRPDDTILYNRWFAEEGYRREICARFGARYRDDTLNEVAHEGGGSSFDGLPLPPVSAMLTGFRKYLGAPFLRRLRTRPMSYVRRLIRPRIEARALNVDRRWTYLKEREEAALLLGNAELRGLNERIFGFSLSHDFAMTPAPQGGAAAAQPV